MGKTKTAFVGGLPEDTKSGEDKYKEKQKKKKIKEEQAKIRVPGLGGGQRVVAVGGDLPPETPADGEPEESAPAKTTTRQRGAKERSKKYKLAKAKVDKNKNYKIEDAVKLVKETSYSKFDGSVELHLVVKKKGLSANATLPHSAGKLKKIEVADEKTLEKLKAEKIDFDILLATPEMMPKLVPFAKLLGPKGLMPNPKTQTIIKDKKDAAKFSKNSLNLKTEKDTPIIHTVVGKVSQKDKELSENINATVDAINPKNIVKAYLKPTMGPSVKLQI